MASIQGSPAVNQQGQPVGQQPALANIVPASAPQAGALMVQEMPDYVLALDKSDTGTDLMSRYIRPPRLKIVQGSAKQELKQIVGESGLVIVPNNIVVAEPINFRNGEKEGAIVQLVPIFFWPEFTLQNPMIGNLPFIADRSTDENSRLARMCRLPDLKAREYPCPEDKTKTCKYVEVMNFIVYIIHPQNLIDTPVVQSFQRGSFGDATDWCKAIKMVKSRDKDGITHQVPAWLQVFEQCVGPRQSASKQDYYGPNIRPSVLENGFLNIITDKAWFDWAFEKFKELDEAYKDGLLKPEYDQEPTGNENGSTNSQTIDTTATPKF